VAKAIDIPGFVCVRVLNGFSEPILAAPKGLRLQKRREKQGREQDFQNIAPFSAKAWGREDSDRIPAGGIADWQLPSSNKPVPPGIYRACLSYTLPGQKAAQEVCSEEFSLSQGEDIPPLPGCPPLPEQEATRRVAIHAGKQLDTTGRVCVRVVNGLGVDIEYGDFALWLQKWEEREGKFLRIEEPDLRGTAVFRIAYRLPARGVLDGRLPYSRQPALVGRYRACFRFGTFGEYAVCSQEFSLP
jgi:hypothetical protein